MAYSYSLLLSYRVSIKKNVAEMTLLFLIKVYDLYLKKLYKRFRKRGFNLKDRGHSGQHKIFKHLLNQNLVQTGKELIA